MNPQRPARGLQSSLEEPGSCLQSTQHKHGVILTIAVFQAEGRTCFCFSLTRQHAPDAPRLPQLETWDSTPANSSFVTEHNFSRAEKDGKTIGLQPLRDDFSGVMLSKRFVRHTLAYPGSLNLSYFARFAVNSTGGRSPTVRVNLMESPLMVPL